MHVCHGSQVLQLTDGNFLGLTGQFSTIKDMRYLSTKMNYTGLITTQTRFQLDKKNEASLYNIVRDKALVPNIVLVCKYF